MKVLIVAVCAFFGALMVPAMFFPALHNIPFHLAGIGFSWSLMLALVIGFVALGLTAKHS